MRCNQDGSCIEEEVSDEHAVLVAIPWPVLLLHIKKLINAAELQLE